MTVNSGDVLEVAARAEFNGVDDIVNVFQYQYQGVPPLADAIVISDLILIMEAFFGLWRGFQSIVVLYRDIRIKNKTQGITFGLFPWVTITAGQATDDPLPPGNAGVLNLDTGVPRVILRKFLGGLTDGALDADGSLNSGTVNAMISAGTQLVSLSVIGGNDYQYGYDSPKVAGFVEPRGLIVTDISGYQRRRKQGRGA